MMARMVGATSAREPCSSVTCRVPFSPVTMKGTRSTVSNCGVYNLTGGVGSVRLASGEVNHLLSVAMIGSDAEHVSRFLARIIDGANGLVGGGDGLNGGIVNSSVTNLEHERTSYCGLTMSGGAKLHMTNSYSPVLTTSATLSATSWTLISGFLS